MVLLACGSSPLGSDLPGLQGVGVVSLDDYLAGRATVGERVVILGGNEGAEAAVSLAREKMEMREVVGARFIAPRKRDGAMKGAPTKVSSQAARSMQYNVR